MKVLIVGNCHIHQIAESLEFILADKVDILRDPLSYKRNKEKLDEVRVMVEQAGTIGILSSFWDDFLSMFPEYESKCSKIPHIRASSFHPDIIEISRNGKRLESVMEVCHSRVIIYGYLNQLDVNEVKSLFTKELFKELGYFQEWDRDLKWARYQSSVTGWDVEALYSKWRHSGCFVHTPNHPKLSVLATLALEFALKNSLDIKFQDVRDVLVDRAASHSIWPVYPDIAEYFDTYGCYLFKPSSKGKNIFLDKNIAIGLDDFISLSYEYYDSISLTIEDFDSATISDFKKISKYLKSLDVKNHGNPYRGLPNYCFWKKAVAQPTIADVDPVVNAKFKINTLNKVATAGSCFAQHIARALSSNGFNYYVAEKAPGNLTTTQALERNFGIFSARFGNIYSTSQLVQLFKRAYGSLSPKIDYIELESGKFVDPFRPYVEPDGFDSVIELRRSMDEHLAFVRTMFESLDVFIFTLGLTEGWRSKSDKSVYPVAPGVVSSRVSNDDFEFFNMTTADIIADLVEFRCLLKEVNPSSRIIFTVSPVPLIATYENRHALVSTTYSKSALRAAADELERGFDDVMYFPSYEIITGNFNRGDYYEEDLRSVKVSGVEHVMKLFMSHCIESVEYSIDKDLKNMIDSSRIVCDEENLEK